MTIILLVFLTCQLLFATAVFKYGYLEQRKTKSNLGGLKC